VVNKLFTNFNVRGISNHCNTFAYLVQNHYNLRFHGHNDLVVKGLSETVNLPIISADDICAIFLTSGSTGMAKAIPFTHRNMLIDKFKWVKLMELEPGELFLDYFPFGWQASLTNNGTHKTNQQEAPRYK
jgi:acyl-coenzyme A synthetase/AMP-(fatty) acid ligase